MDQKAFNLLLIEDNPGDVRLIHEMLLNNSVDVVALDTQSTLQKGIAVLREQIYDTILLDLSLPDSHGLDTLLKLYAEAPHIPIIVLTNSQEEGLGTQTVQHGAQDYLPKEDMTSKLLMRAIRYAIERHRVDMALRQSEEEYRSLIDDVFDTSMVAVIILNSNYLVVWCNEAAEIYFGIERERLLGRDKRVLIDDELKCVFADPDDYAARLLKAYSEGSFLDRFECHVQVSDGREERWLEHWSQPIRNGKYAGGRIEQYTDITDRKFLEFAEAEQRQFSEALTNIAKLITGSLDLEEVLGRILSNLDQLVPHDSASITLVEDNQFRVARHRSSAKRDTQEMVAEKTLLNEYKHFQERIHSTRRPVIVNDLSNDSVVGEIAQQAHLRSYAGVPIQLKKRIIGFINVLSRTADRYAQDDVIRLAAFAELAAIALQNASAYTQSQQLATMEERQRIARDLHDSVSQTLFTSRAMVESALRRWERDPERAHGLVEEVHQQTLAALSEMRILLLELRPAAMTRISLRELFEQYLKPIQERRSFAFKLSVTDVPPLPPEVQIALYRIAQEALNNADKHAHAKHVELRVEVSPQEVALIIEDDGVGFVVDSTKATSLGLGIMRERAESIQAVFNVESAVNVGTTIKIIWKIQESG